MNTNEFSIRPCTKRELAERYFPQCDDPELAMLRFRRLLYRNPKLMKELTEAGYRLQQHYFTAKMVRIIVSYLGEP